MKDIKIIEPEQEVVEVPTVDTYYLPFLKLTAGSQWEGTFYSSLPRSIEEAKQCFNSYKQIGLVDCMILKVKLPAEYLEGNKLMEE